MIPQSLDSTRPARIAEDLFRHEGARIVAMIQRGIQHLALAATGVGLSEYHLEAGIAACHSTSAGEAATDWTRILSFYGRLVKPNHSSVVALKRAVAVARVHGPQAGLDALGAIPSRSSLESYHLFHAVCGTFAAELRRFDEACTHFRKAEALTTVPAEKEFLAHRIRECAVAQPV